MRNLKKLAPIAIFVLALSTLTSCNRGYGCPNSISVGKTILKAAVQNVSVAPIKAILD
ncbi:MAG: hypothetical protein AB8G15_15880 [Saprospiraceae bacterium]